MILRLAIVALVGILASCDRTPKDGGVDAAVLTAAPAREVVPPVAPFNATPVAQVADAGNLDTQPPFEQAKVFEANGQLWMARLVLERKALGPDGTKDETELLARVCQRQGDEACVEASGKKLGRAIKLDAAGPRPEPVTRKTLEPKVLDGKATREEIRLLRAICQAENDRMCTALCDSKLK